VVRKYIAQKEGRTLEEIEKEEELWEDRWRCLVVRQPT
jgi:hypothetical protein